MLLGAGFAIHWNDRISTYAYYDGELFRTNYLSNNVSAGFRVTFSSARAFVERRDVTFQPVARVASLRAALACFEHCGASSGESRRIEACSHIDVQAVGFGSVSPADITAVLKSAAGEIWQYCPEARIPGLGVYSRFGASADQFRARVERPRCHRLDSQEYLMGSIRFSVCTRVLPHVCKFQQ